MKIILTIFLLLSSLNATYLLKAGNAYYCIEDYSIYNKNIYYHRSDSPTVERSYSKSFEIFEDYTYINGDCVYEPIDDTQKYSDIIKGVLVSSILIWSLI